MPEEIVAEQCAMCHCDLLKSGWIVVLAMAVLGCGPKYVCVGVSDTISGDPVVDAHVKLVSMPIMFDFLGRDRMESCGVTDADGEVVLEVQRGLVLHVYVDADGYGVQDGFVGEEDQMPVPLWENGVAPGTLSVRITSWENGDPVDSIPKRNTCW